MIKLVNAHDMLTVNYALLQLKGYLEPWCGCEEIMVCRLASTVDEHKLCWLMCYGQLKAFVPLLPGINSVILTCEHFQAELRIVFEPPRVKPSHIVSAVYVICADGPEEFQTPFGQMNSTALAACKRIAFGMQLLQSLTAESLLAELGHRQTFFLSDSTDEFLSATLESSQCLIHRSSMRQAEVFQSAPDKVWRTLARELYAAHPDRFEQTKWIAFMSCTRYKSSPESMQSNDVPYEELLRSTKGYFALGSGGLALLGTGTLHAWPEDLATLQAALLDSRRVDHFGLMDDTAYRHTFWAAFATGLGSVWHELGHCLGLNHSLEGIMHRGGDDIHLCISFPPRGSLCSEGCRLVACENLRDSCTPFQEIPPQFRSPPPINVGVQFQRYVCLRQPKPLVKHDLISHPSSTSSTTPFAFCQSLWHQGSAFWGFDQAVKLSRCPWIFSVSS